MSKVESIRKVKKTGRPITYNLEIQKRFEKVVEDYNPEGLNFFKFYTYEHLAINLWLKNEPIKERITAMRLKGWIEAYKRGSDDFIDFYNILQVWKTKRSAALASLGEEFLGKNPTQWLFLLKCFMGVNDGTRIDTIYNSEKKDNYGQLTDDQLRDELKVELEKAQKIVSIKKNRRK